MTIVQSKYVRVDIDIDDEYNVTSTVTDATADVEQALADQSGYSQMLDYQIGKAHARGEHLKFHDDLVVDGGVVVKLVGVVDGTGEGWVLERAADVADSDAFAHHFD